MAVVERVEFCFLLMDLYVDIVVVPADCERRETVSVC